MKSKILIFQSLKFVFFCIVGVFQTLKHEFQIQVINHKKTQNKEANQGLRK